MITLDKLKEFGFNSFFELAKKTAEIPEGTKKIVLMFPHAVFGNIYAADHFSGEGGPKLMFPHAGFGNIYPERIEVDVDELHAAALNEILRDSPTRDDVREILHIISSMPVDTKSSKNVIDFLYKVSK